MARSFVRFVHSFRQSYKATCGESLHWFPGHMGRGIKQMQQKLKDIDLVIEVHDARIPLSGRNPNFKQIVLGMKPHVLVLNKSDLAVHSRIPAVKDKLAKEHGIHNIIYTNCKDQKCPGVKTVIPTCVDLINSSERFNRSKEKDFCIMVIGVPNVGKSSLINALRYKYIRKGRASAVGAEAGVTKSVLNIIKVSENPTIFLLDTPGILTPNVPNVEMGLRLALCASLQDHLVGEEVIADYLLFWLNKHENFKYVELMGLDGPTDNIGLILTKGAIKLNKYLKFRSHEGYIYRPDLLCAANYFIKAFREGQLGTMFLDTDLLEKGTNT